MDTSPLIQLEHVASISYSFIDSTFNTGSIEMVLLEKQLTESGTCPNGAIEIANRLWFFFRLDPDVNDVEFYLGLRRGDMPKSKKAYSFEERWVAPKNILKVIVKDGKLLGASLNNNQLHDVTPYSWDYPIDHFTTHKAILESMFGADWFTTNVRKKNRHPAFLRWSICDEIIRRGLKSPGTANQLPEIAAMMLDNYALLLCSKGDTDKNLFGNMAEYGSESVMKRIQAEIVSTFKFYDVMLELKYAAWHISRGNQVTPTDEQGTADFEVVISGEDLPIYVDCKRIKRGTNDARFGDIIKHGGKQIKTSSQGKDCVGILVIDVSDKIPQPEKLSDDYPDEILHIINIIKGRLSGQLNNSVSAVMLLWNDFTMLGAPGVTTSSHVAFRQRNCIIKHEKPDHVLPESTILAETGNIVEFNVYWSASNV